MKIQVFVQLADPADIKKIIHGTPFEPAQIDPEGVLTYEFDGGFEDNPMVDELIASLTAINIWDFNAVIGVK